MNTQVEEKITNVGPAGSSVMQNFDLYKPLVELSSAIGECRKELQGDVSWKRKADLRKIARSLEHKLTQQCEELIYRTLNTWDADESLSLYLSGELNALKSGTDENWHGDIDYVKVRLARLAENEGRKSTLRRKLERYGWMLAIAVVVVSVFAVRWYSQVDLSYPPQTATGVVQGSHALQKLANYDDTLGDGIDNVGLFRRVVMWPVKPAPGETRYALKFMGATVEVYDQLQKENKICGTEIAHQPDNGSYEDELAIAMVVADYIDATGSVNNSESGTRLIERAFKKRYYCG